MIELKKSHMRWIKKSGTVFVRHWKCHTKIQFATVALQADAIKVGGVDKD